MWKMTPSAPIAFPAAMVDWSAATDFLWIVRSGAARLQRYSAWQTTPPIPFSARLARNASIASSEWFVGRHIRGLCVNSWTQSPPIAAIRSIAVSIPPADETCAPNSTGAYDRERHVRESPHGAEPDRLPPHRKGAHVPLQLAVRAPAGRRVPAPDREHRYEPRGGGGRRPDPGVAALDRHRVGRADLVPARHRRPGARARPRARGERSRV